ncbi:MAG: murein biosynthesis integral membrane protein MurJ [Myxococcales bacterium]|nr:murein biosynthesis integral membrane protein MurJ [Myxococcales bacterium]
MACPHAQSAATCRGLVRAAWFERQGAVSQAEPKQETSGRAALAVSLGILLSRGVGLVRQRVTAHYFGTSVIADVLAASFRIGNVAQNLFGEGTLSASFIPVYARLRAQGKHDEARELARASLGLLALAVVVVSALGVALAPWLSLAVAWGFGAEERALTTELVRILFPMTGLLVIGAWALGVLNAHGDFFVSYAAPVAWSAVQIAALVVAGSVLGMREEKLAWALSLGAFGGASLQLGLLLARARRYLGTLHPTLSLAVAGTREAISKLPSALLGRGVVQLSGLVDTLLVSFLGAGAMATFGYAQMLYLLPMSVLGTGEAAAALPELASATAASDATETATRIRVRLVAGLARTLTLAVPAVVVLCGFANELVVVLLRTGEFAGESSARVAEALSVYGVALIGNAAGRLFATASFALGDTRTPARCAIARVVVSTLCSLALMQRFGVRGVVAGAALAAWLEAGLLAARLRGELGGLGLATLPTARLLALALLTLGPPMAAARYFAGRTSEPLIALVVLTLAGAAFLAAAWSLKLVSPRSLFGRRS